MSRVGIKPIEIPGGVKVTINGQKVTVEGPKGTLSREFSPLINVGWSEDEKSVVCTIKGESSREAKALWGTTRALIQNMVIGVKDGYEKSLEIVGVGWGASVAGQALKLSVGYANAVNGAEKHVSAERLADPVIYPPKEIRDRFFVVPPKGQAYDRARTRAWTRFKTGM